MPKANVNGIEVYYEQTGQGPDVVMVHGLAANHAFWYLRIVPLLKEHFRITVLDLRGHGLSSMPESGYTTRAMADDLSGLAEVLGLSRPHLVGHSLGAAVILHFAILYPERAASLTLIDCRIHALQPLRNPEDTAYWIQRRAELEARGIAVPDETPKVVYMMLDELGTLNEAGLRPASPGLPLTDGGWNPNSRAAKRWRRLATTTTFAQDIRSEGGLTCEAIAEVMQPTLLSYGGDSYCMETCRGLEALLPNHRTVLHARLGHFFPAVSPQLAADDVRTFVTEVDGSYVGKDKVRAESPSCDIAEEQME